MLRLRAGITIVILAALVVVSSTVVLPHRVHATVTCTKGVSRLATAADLNNMTLAGIPNPTVGMEYCPDDINIGAAAGDAKIYLRSILCKPDGDNYGGTGPDGTIEGLDSEFAKCAASFLKSLNTSGGAYCIREGKRTVEKQNAYVARGVIACTKGALCEHPRGIAIDINTLAGPVNSCDSYQRAHQLAPQFGLTFYLGCKDAYHFVPQKTGCSAGGTAAAYGSGTGGSYPTGGTNGYLPASYYDYPQYAPSPSPLNSLVPFTNALTNLSQQQSTQPAQQYGAPTTQTTYPNYAADLPTASSTYLAPNLYTVPTSTPIVRTTQTGPSASDQIRSLSGDTDHTTGRSSQSATSAPTRLNADLYDIGGDSNTGGTNASMDELAIADTIASTSVAVNPIHVPETFSGNEPTAVLAPTTSGATSANKTLVVALLTTLRNLLISFVQILKAHPTYGFQGSWQPVGPHIGD